MNSPILVADASMPFAASLAALLRQREAVVSLVSPDAASAADIIWNRPSALSAKTVAIDAENRMGRLAQAVLVFDRATVSDSLSLTDPSAPLRCADDFVRGYLLLARELCARLAASGGRLTFVYRDVGDAAPNALARVAASAFQSLGDECAALSASSAAKGPSASRGAASRDAAPGTLAAPAGGFSAVTTLLVRVESPDDDANLAWLADQLLNPSPRVPARWLKAGSKGLFGLM